MKFCSSQWAYAAFGLILAIGFLPDIASGQGQITSGTATHVGGIPLPGDGEGDGQVNISGTIPLDGQDPDLRQCTLTISEILTHPPGGDELVKDVPVVGDLCVGETSFGPLQPRRGSKANDAIFESDQRQRPTLRIQIKNRGRGVLEFSSGLKISRACINKGPIVDPDVCDPNVNPSFPLGTSFQLTCPGGPIPFNDAPLWRVVAISGGDNNPKGCNIKTP